MDHGRINILAAIETLLFLQAICKHVSQDELPEQLLIDATNWLDDWQATNPESLSKLASISKVSTRNTVARAANSLMTLLETIPGKEARRLVSHPDWTEVERQLVIAYESLRGNCPSEVRA